SHPHPRHLHSFPTRRSSDLRHREVRLPPEQAVEVNWLALATLYSFVIPAKGTLSLFDTGVLFLMFAGYVREHQEEDARVEERERSEEQRLNSSHVAISYAVF